MICEVILSSIMGLASLRGASCRLNALSSLCPRALTDLPPSLERPSLRGLIRPGCWLPLWDRSCLAIVSCPSDALRSVNEGLTGPGATGASRVFCGRSRLVLFWLVGGVTKGWDLVEEGVEIGSALAGSTLCSFPKESVLSR